MQVVSKSQVQVVYLSQVHGACRVPIAHGMEWEVVIQQEKGKKQGRKMRRKGGRGKEGREEGLNEFEGKERKK